MRNNVRRLKRGRIASSSSSSSQRPLCTNVPNVVNDNDANRSPLTSSSSSSSSSPETSSSFASSSAVMTQSEATAQRSLYAAFLWHKDVVHDAMACSSFLKFHSSLSKQQFLTTSPDDDQPTPHRLLTSQDPPHLQHHLK